MHSKMMYDFECDASREGGGCGIFFEDRVYSFEQETKCPNCGRQAARVLSAPKIWWKRFGVDTSFPTASAKWEKMQREKARSDKGGRADGQPNLKEY